jgi:Fe-S cluster assembly protein SufD
MATEIVEHYLSDFTDQISSDRTGFPEWVEGIRRRAIGRFVEVGFPSSRDEKWRFTNFSRIAEKHFVVSNGHDSRSSPVSAEDAMVGWRSPTKIVFVDGRYSPDLSSLRGLPQCAVAGNLAAMIGDDSTNLENHLARIADSSDNPFTALNTAFFSEGALLSVPDGVKVNGPIQFLYLTSSETNDAVNHPRNVVVLGEGAEATVVESYIGLGSGCSWTNAVTEIYAGDAAHIRVHRVQLEGKNAFHTATTQCSQGRDSSFFYTTVEFGGSLSRHDINFQLNGTGAFCSLHGLSHLRDTQHADNQTTVEHAQPHCTSVEHFNGIYDDSSHGVFTGRVLVRPGAQKTDAIQSSRNLLLTDTARADTQPQLEIFADDVKCTHGATVGPIDDEALFYLRSKGLTADEARTMLTYGFAVEIIDTVGIAGLREHLDSVLTSRLEKETRDARGEKC